MNLINILFIIFSGILVTPILNGIGICNGIDGINYYAEIHQSKWNSMVHTIGMPFTFYGISCWVSALFQVTNKHKNKMQIYIWSMYAIHYMYIDFFKGLICILYYIYPILMAYKRTKYTVTDRDLFIHGFLVSTIALVLQEFIGHYMGGDEPSRFKGIPNAILYAPYYSTYHLF